MGGIDQMTEGVAELQKESVGWCVDERGHRGNWVLHNGVMLKVVNKCCDGAEHPVGVTPAGVSLMGPCRASGCWVRNARGVWWVGLCRWWLLLDGEVAWFVDQR